MPLLYSWTYHTMAVIIVVHRLHRCIGLLIVFLFWPFAQHLLKLWNLVLREGAFRSVPTRIIWILLLKCTLFSPMEITFKFWDITMAAMPSFVFVVFWIPLINVSEGIFWLLVQWGFFFLYELGFFVFFSS